MATREATQEGPATGTKIKVRGLVWIPACKGNERGVYELAKVESIADDEKSCRVVANSGPQLTVPIEHVQLTNPRVVPDMTSLYHINEAGILHNLKIRSEQDLPYTNMGSVLVSVNPLHPVPDPELEAGKAMSEVPHPFSIAETAFKNMTFCFERRQQRQRQLEILERGGHDVGAESEIELVVNQSVVISGESGSGKTEAGKRVLRHLVTRAGVVARENAEHELDVQLAGVGPILEAFGNASTVCNHNSSRFGKFSKLHFVQQTQGRKRAKSWCLVGATVETYLLEQSRVVNHSKGERNFHVFYQLLTGVDDERRAALGLPALENAADFRYLMAGALASSSSPEAGTTAGAGAGGRGRAAARRRGGGGAGGGAGGGGSGGRSGGLLPPAGRQRAQLSQETVRAKDQSNFAELCKALEDIGKTPEETRALFELVAGVLHLGNVSFTSDESQTSDAAKLGTDPRSQRGLERSSALLGVPAEDLSSLLLQRQVKAGMEVITAQLDVTSAQYARDALAKWTYGIVFHWLVKEVNAVLMSSYQDETPLKDLPFIGVLDIFGFESFQRNGFEQLLINYTNESLQSTFNYQVFVAEADLYKREGLILAGEPFVCPSDDGDCLDLFEGKVGRTGLLKEIDSESRAPRPADDKLNRRLHTAFQGVRSFPKPHPKDLATTFRIHHYAGVVEYTVGDFVEKNNDRIPANMNSLMQASANPVVRAAFNAARPRSTTKKTVVANFGGQIRALVETLESTKCSFIRCVKPNPEMQWARGTNWFNNQYVNEQLKCLSIPQTAAVLKSGFPTRIDYSSIVTAYASALPADALGVWKRSNGGEVGQQSGRTFVSALFWAFRVPKEAFRLGLSKVFFSSGMIDLLDRIMLEAASWAEDEGKDSEEKLDVVRRFKLYYARLSWRRCLAKVIATNKFLDLLRGSRARGAAVRAVQRATRAFLLRCRIRKRIIKRRRALQEAERRAREEAERRAREATEQRKPRLAIDPRSSPLVSSSNKLPPRAGGSGGSGGGGNESAVASSSGSAARKAFRSSKRLSTGWSLQGALHTPKGSIKPELLDLVEHAQTTLKKDNDALREQNEKLHSDLEELKEDIQLLKKSMPFTHILHIY